MPGCMHRELLESHAWVQTKYISHQYLCSSNPKLLIFFGGKHLKNSIKQSVTWFMNFTYIETYSVFPWVSFLFLTIIVVWFIHVIM